MELTINTPVEAAAAALATAAASLDDDAEGAPSQSYAILHFTGFLLAVPPSLLWS
ncbi:MAG: hypothetical protein QOH09_2805 [Pseudonocardiales bacterium]|jgi:hypothetical protein|nr:hypothetical protein [Pseudonocardiales bacterium]